jgi:hypothetical protein
MTWFDGIILLLVLGLVILEARREAGRSLLDAVATLAALHFTHHLAPVLTTNLGWKPLAGTDSAPGAMALAFGLLWAFGLAVAWVLHQRTRWTMEQYDIAFSLAFGLIVAIGAGHMVTEVTARTALARSGEVPPYIRRSLVAEELRSFHTYHYVIDTLGGVRNHRSP